MIDQDQKTIDSYMFESGGMLPKPVRTVFSYQRIPRATVWAAKPMMVTPVAVQPTFAERKLRCAM